MFTAKLKQYIFPFLRRWGISLLLLPLMLYTLDMIYLTLRYNIFFSITYEYPFPLNVLHFFLDNFLLIVHEAGHTFFGVVSVRFITILGGSLFQIVLPLLIASYFFHHRNKTGIQCSMVLMGFSWLDVAAYAADGQARQLPLIGGLSDRHHDWFNLLHDMDLLAYDLQVGVGFAAVGLLSYLTALFWPFMHREYRQVNLSLDL